MSKKWWIRLHVFHFFFKYLYLVWCWSYLRVVNPQCNSFIHSLLLLFFFFFPRRLRLFLKGTTYPSSSIVSLPTTTTGSSPLNQKQMHSRYENILCSHLEISVPFPQFLLCVSDHAPVFNKIFSPRLFFPCCTPNFLLYTGAVSLLLVVFVFFKWDLNSDCI